MCIVTLSTICIFYLAYILQCWILDPWSDFVDALLKNLSYYNYVSSQVPKSLTFYSKFYLIKVARLDTVENKASS